jgi:hypothetical protein
MFLIGGNVKQRQRRFKRATRDLAQHSWWKSWTNSPLPLFGFNDAAPVSAEAWASLGKEFRERVYDIIGIRNVLPEWDTGNFVYR